MPPHTPSALARMVPTLEQVADHWIVPGPSAQMLVVIRTVEVSMGCVTV